MDGAEKIGEAKDNLRQAIELILKTKRMPFSGGFPDDAIQARQVMVR